jgi:outer membrane PBP1 activator LpoA protein
MKYPTHIALRALMLMFLSTLITACVTGPPKPTIDYKTDYDFTAVKKIAFYDDSGQVSGDNPLRWWKMLARLTCW